MLFLSRFCVSKWHPKILPWHPNFWKPRYGFALYWSKTIWGKHVFLHVAIATDGCNVIGRHIFLAQNLEAKIVSLVSAHSHVQRVAYCFTVSIGLPGDASDHTTMKTKVRQLQWQCACNTGWLSSEASVRARSEMLAVWAALKQLAGNENDATCVVLLGLVKTKIFNMVLLSTMASPLTEPSKVFQVGCFDSAQVRASVELCINTLYDAAAKSELKANCEKFDSGLGELRTPDGLADSGVSSGMAFWKSAKRLANWQSQFTKWRQELMNQLPRHLFA